MKTENIQYRLLKTGWVLLSLIPFSVMYFISDLLFIPLYYLIQYRRKLVRKNLMESFPEKSISEIIKIEKGFYHFLIDYIFETCKIATISKDSMRKRMKFFNVEEIESDLKQGKSISLMLGHYGNWEWISSIPLNISPDIHFTGGQVYQLIRNKAVDQLLLENRNSFGVESVELHHILKWINRKLRHKEVSMVGYIADQSPAWHSMHHWTMFLNHFTPALTGTERMTKKYGFQAYYVDVKRVKRGYYEAEFVKIHEDPKSLPDYQLTDLYLKMLEKSIRRNPSYYLWSHNRFKKTKEDYERMKGISNENKS